MEERKQDCVMLVDDEPANLLILNNILSPEYTVISAKGGEEAITRAQEEIPDLIILDIIMPDVDGYETLTRLKAAPETKSIPIIFITALDKPEDEEKGLMLGAVDYIAKPFKNGIVLARVRAHLQIVHQMRTIERMGLIDPLTNIPNRRAFDDRLTVEWKRALRNREPLSFLMIDVDHFKKYNDTYGHPQGDVMLKTLAQVFSTSVRRPGDMAARLGGEEFGVLLPATDIAAAKRIAEEIRADAEEIRLPLADGAITRISVSIGVSGVLPAADKAARDIVNTADKNLYKAKERGRNCVCAGD